MSGTVELAMDAAGVPVEEPVALQDDLIAHHHATLPQVDLQGRDPTTAGFPNWRATRRGMAGAPAAAGENTVGRQHAVDVIRLGLGPHHDHLLALLLGPYFGDVGIEGHHAVGRAGGDVRAPGPVLCPRSAWARPCCRIGDEEKYRSGRG